ncbi:MAG: protein translocase subunit SecDF [Bacteroidetes bacterium]|nr:protein translocase subunit SecDF [Bacteroidota bacterium]MBS1974282.1 protein translocase subunit SecDF [Bacteroidota bacterium]
MRVLVSIFAALLIFISLYQLSFTWFVNKHESAMQEKAKRYVNNVYPSAAKKYPGNKEEQAIYQDTLDDLYKDRLKHLLDSTKDTKITWWGTSYEKSKENELSLGLDLQGGINVTLDISLDGLIKSLANNPHDPSLLKAIETAKQKKVTSDVNFIDLFAQSYKEQNPNNKLAPLFANSGRNNISLDASDATVISYVHSQASAGMKQTFQVLTKRIDKFGVAQPSINLDENKGIINVELAGANIDPERVRRYLQSTANLQFWELYNINDLSQYLQNADKALQRYLNGTNPSDTSKKEDSLANAKNANPLIPFFYAAIADIQKSTDKSRAPDYVGIVPLKDTAKANEYLSNPVVLNSFPSNIKFLWGKQEIDDNGKAVNYLKLYAIKTVPGSEKAKLEGESVKNNARQDYDPVTGDVVVEMSMDKKGSDTWAKMTTDNVGKPIAIVLDDIVYSAPFVNGPITGGNSQITMGRGKNTQQTVEEGQDLANILNSGKLSAPAKIVAEQVVGPSIGKQAIHGGQMAFAISFIVIFVLMIVYFNTAGWVANVALIFNLLFTIGVLSSLHATLTAPGIAGLVLTIGMAVDTNVIIFERIKEELARGKSYPLAVSDGYRRSLAPVLDAHVTTLLTALILFYFGLGPVLGFATTQILGILLSLFCGILLSRLITDFYTNKNRHFKYFTPISKRIFQHAKFKFIEYRKIAYAISVVVTVLGIASFFHGFREGVEFRGGRSYVVSFVKPVDAEKIRETLDVTFGSSPTVKTYGGTNQFEITTDYLIKQEGSQTDSVVLGKLYEGLKTFLPDGTTSADFLTPNKFIHGSKKVEPTISDDIKQGAFKAVIFAIAIIFIYIFIRFRDWRYSLGTIVSLFHDVFVTLAVFSFLKDIVPFPMEIDQHFIAAVLTVIGFSMNDTVIVFDRIREDSRLMKGATKAEIINKAINDTLSRTIMTSLTVFLTLLILFLVGGEVTKGFAFAMLIGVVTGTYSSIFVAAPILVDLAKNKPLGTADSASVEGKPKTKPAVAKSPASPIK